MSEALLPTTTPERSPFVGADKTRVLIVDDDRRSRTVCVSYCDLFDHASQGVRTLAEALSALRREAFDIVVLNVHGAAQGGMTALKAIRALPSPVGAVPVVGVAGMGRGDEAQRWRAAGFSALVAKPVSAAKFHAALTSARLDDPAGRRSWAPVE